MHTVLSMLSLNICFHTTDTAALIRGYKSVIRPVFYCMEYTLDILQVRQTSWKNVQRYVTRLVTTVVNWNTNMITVIHLFIDIITMVYNCTQTH